jgi:hypothetical protein
MACCDLIVPGQGWDWSLKHPMRSNLQRELDVRIDSARLAMRLSAINRRRGAF